MKLRFLLPALVLAATSMVYAQAPAAAAGGFQITKINRELMPTPEYTLSQGPTVTNNGRERWLEVEVDFSATPEFTDELTFKYYILIDGKLLTGEVTHVNILAGQGAALGHVCVAARARASHRQSLAHRELAPERRGADRREGAVKDELSLVRARPQWFSALPH